MAEPPSGTVTFLFTDIEGSTARWEDQPEAMRLALAATTSCSGQPSSSATATTTALH